MSLVKEEKGAGHLLSFLLSGVFFLCVGFGFHLLYEFDAGVRSLRDVTFFEFFILSLAVFRITRLIVYDKVSEFIRDMFLVTSEEYDEERRITYIMRAKYDRGVRRLMADLLSCPWCVGVWAAVFAVVGYFLLPATWPFWLLMAVAGAASFFQLLSNLIGWQAEYGKIVVQKTEQK